MLDAQKRAGVVDRDHESGIDETATMDEPGVGVHQAGNLVDHAKTSLRNGTGWIGKPPAARSTVKLAHSADQRYFEGPRSLRLAAQDVALSRRKQGFESPRERQ